MDHRSTTRDRTELDVRPTPLTVTITARTPVAAPPARVWEVLTDTAAYPLWNPFVRRLEGPLVPGGRITVVMKPGEREQQLRPRVVDLVPGRSFTWLGRVGVPGLLDGRHTFSVEPADHPGRTSLLVQHERLSGVLVPVFRAMLLRDTPRAFAALNDALAARAEGPDA